MKKFAWNDAKNRKLQSERNVSFEQVVIHLAAGALLDVVEHPNRSKYPEQRMFIVRMKDYAWLVPFVESETEIFQDHNSESQSH